jgi:hypothetical protein
VTILKRPKSKRRGYREEKERMQRRRGEGGEGRGRWGRGGNEEEERSGRQQKHKFEAHLWISSSDLNSERLPPLDICWAALPMELFSSLSLSLVAEREAGREREGPKERERERERERGRGTRQAHSIATGTWAMHLHHMDPRKRPRARLASLDGVQHPPPRAFPEIKQKNRTEVTV